MLILTATRNGNLTANPLMDSLFYHYTSGTNKLSYVDDYGVTAYGINTDIKDQSPNNYQYDAIGNLKSHAQRVVSNIKWNVYGKIEHVEKGAIANATAQDLHFNYDPLGNRIGQFQRHRSGAPMFYNYIWYVRDAQGNVLAVYKVEDVTSPSAGTLKLTEHHMYGSSRLGIINRDMDADQPKHTPENIDQLGDAYLINFTRGNKFFEITNHLGNVMLTVTDKRMPVPVSGNPSVIASYTADVATAVDYSPFGMSLPGRIYNNHWQKYRYGFNGKESDNEFYGPYNELDYGFRIYDPRLGRFLSVDPLTSKFPWYTPYQYAGNRPVASIDIDGLEPDQLPKSTPKVGPGLTVVPESAPPAKVIPLKPVAPPVSGATKFLNSLKWFGSRAAGIIPLLLTPDYTPARNPNEMPLPYNVPESYPDPFPEEDKNEKYITVYRGMGESEKMDYKDKVAYAYAQAKIAVPKGLIPDNSNKKIVENPDEHVAADNNSIFTSWTLSSAVAERFARGKEGQNKNPIVLVKRVKVSELIYSQYSDEYYSNDLEILLKGIRTADGKYDANYNDKKNQ